MAAYNSFFNRRHKNLYLGTGFRKQQALYTLHGKSSAPGVIDQGSTTEGMG
jgi:hypothetical protein